ncbi:MAG: YebC/PmpR family DNA-binding transcriptional regulator [Armatimonadetes bacterium]|nr:YebC/PmpR family DNA-binding transcriptional regulator [Armatimonadota bacterium]MDI9583312.1 YebC/PmpR family DNA-binding transcriptional regulator [Acidobacteriota bacterium]
MAGHSKWANRVHRKTRQDAKRSSIFSKLSREIIVAAREGGGNPDTNLRLRYAIDAAREASMPNENVDNAIRRGTGEVEGVTYENVVYEGYGPGGTALMISCLTDNSQRTVSELRNILKKKDSSLGEPGSVSWVFEQKGVIIVPKAGIEEEELFMAAIDAGAEDMLTEDEDVFEIRTPAKELHQVASALAEQGIEYERAEITMIPTSTCQVPDDLAGKLFALLDQLNDHDDVQRVYGNFEVSDAALEAYDQG